MAVTDGQQKICIISNDLMELSPSLAGEIRTEISRRSGLPYDNILLHCIHTHSAPRFGGASAQPGGTNAAYKERAVEAIIANAVQAITDEKSYQDFSLEIAKGTTDINRNRCEASGPVDHALYAAKLVDRSGKPICAFFNLACHPVSMGHVSYMLSSDYSGVARREISKDWGCEVFQFTGASGNMNPVGPERTFEQAEIIGGKLYESLKALQFEAVPGIGLTTDIIVGFPGETEEQFRDTLSIVEEVGYDSAFTFIYSPRTGTVAAGMSDQVPEDLATERIQRLIAAQEAGQRKAMARFIGMEEEVLVEGLSRRSNKAVSGHGRHGVSITLPGSEADIGKIIRVKVTAMKNNTLMGERIDENQEESSHA